MFFLVMQFLWKYIDDLIGKGLEISILLELLFYVSATLIPLALPLAVLFSSIMTYGNLAEHNELTALKASGMSLLKVMRPMFVFVLFLAMGAFYFTNYMLPVANYKWRAIIYDITEKKPTFGITPGVFYNDIDNYSIKVDEKNDDTGDLIGVLIYEYGEQNVAKTIKAKSGKMLKSDDSRYMFLKLISGAMYEKIGPSQVQNDRYPFQKTFFDEAIIRFDMGGFEMEESDEDMFKRDFEMMNYAQLAESLDSLEVKYKKDDASFREITKNQLVTLNTSFQIDSTMDSTKQVLIEDMEAVDTIILLENMHESEITLNLTDAQSEIRGTKDMLFGNQKMVAAHQTNVNQYKTTWHQKFTLPVAIMVLFFIGAPLGAIIRKGGLGTPLVFATLFFLLYYILTIMGENMVSSGFMIPWKGMWMSTFILLPLGAFLTYKAANDSALFDIDVYKKYFRKIFRKAP
ncbi:MAG: lipopolysaccharide export system permease protein [Arenicella sp.]|jgi:lipopolysaccharide export system permease protein